MIVSDQRLKVAFNSGGTPSISAITMTGSALARSAITSKEPFASTLSSCTSAISRMRGSISRIRRGVKSRHTSLRSRECCGGSEPSMLRDPKKRP